MEVLFGPWDRFRSLTLGPIAVESLEAGQDVIARIKTSERFSLGWIYPPLTRPLTDARPNAPLIPATAFSLAPTHRLLLQPPMDDQDLANFLIALIGLLDGVRLTRDGWSHFYKAPIEHHKLSDLVVGGREIMEVLRVAAHFWLDVPAEVRVRMFGAVHWALFSGLYEHDFERFGSTYSAFDALYDIHVRLGRPEFPRHAGRAAGLASYYSMPTPPWAALTNGTCELATLRNDLVHEARYAGAPTGFAHPSAFPRISMELSAFVSRLALAIIGVACGYTISSVTTRQMHGLDLPGPLAAV